MRIVLQKDRRAMVALAALLSERLGVPCQVYEPDGPTGG